MTSNKDTGRHSYYDVEKFRRVYLNTLNKSQGIRKIMGRVSSGFGSVSGIWVTFLSPLIVFGVIFIVAMGAYFSASFGPLVFIGLFALVIGALSLYAHRTVGDSLQFGEYRIWKRTLAQSIAFLAVLGIVFGLVFLTKLPRPF